MSETALRVTSLVAEDAFTPAYQVVMHGAQQAEGKDGYAYGNNGEPCPHLAPEGVLHDHLGEYHELNTPFSRCLMTCAFSAACGSWVTMMIGLAHLGVQPVHEVEHVLCRLPVQVAGGLIGHQDRRVDDNGPGYGHALLFAAGELVRVVVHAVESGSPLTMPSPHARAFGPWKGS